jgi:hypothetical protein
MHFEDITVEFIFVDFLTEHYCVNMAWEIQISWHRIAFICGFCYETIFIYLVLSVSGNEFYNFKMFKNELYDL